MFTPAGNGKKAAGHILKWSTNQTCPDPAGFTAAMKDMFKLEAQINTPEGIELDKVQIPPPSLPSHCSLNMLPSGKKFTQFVMLCVNTLISMRNMKILLRWYCNWFA